MMIVVVVLFVALSGDKGKGQNQYAKGGATSGDKAPKPSKKVHPKGNLDDKVKPSDEAGGDGDKSKGSNDGSNGPPEPIRDNSQDKMKDKGLRDDVKPVMPLSKEEDDWLPPSKQKKLAKDLQGADFSAKLAAIQELKKLTKKQALGFRRLLVACLLDLREDVWSEALDALNGIDPDCADRARRARLGLQGVDSKGKEKPPEGVRLAIDEIRQLLRDAEPLLPLLLHHYGLRYSSLKTKKGGRTLDEACRLLVAMANAAPDDPEVNDKVLTALRGYNPRRLNYTAAVLCTRIKHGLKGVPDMDTFIRSGAPKVRRIAVMECLVRLAVITGDGGATAAVKKLLRHEDEEISRLALQKSVPPAVPDPLADESDTTSMDQRASDSDPSDAQTNARSEKKDDDLPDVRLADPDPAMPGVPAAIRDYINRLRPGRPRRERVEAARALGNYGELAKPACRALCYAMLDPKDPELRVAAADALKKIDPRIQYIAVSMVTDGNLDVLLPKIQNLEKDGEPLTPLVIWAAQSPNRSRLGNRLSQAITTLSHIAKNDPIVFKEVLKAFGNPSPQVRLAAMDAVTRMKDGPQAIPTILKMIDKEAVPQNRATAIRAAAELADRSNAKAVMKVISGHRYDGQEAVRRAAEEADNKLKNKLLD